METGLGTLKEKLTLPLYYIPFLLLLLVLTPTTCHEFDCLCWSNWASFQYQYGITKIYQSGTDYMPLYHYILNLYSKFYDQVEEIPKYIYRIKYITYLFEFGSTLLLFQLLFRKFQNFFKALFFSLFYLLNFAVIYNSAIWGQVDGIMTFFTFGSIIFAFYKKTTWSLLMFILAINMKLQAVFFTPLLLYILALNFDRQYFLKYIKAFVAAMLLQLIILVPIYLNGDLSTLWKVITSSKGKYPNITMNAYNLWTFFVEEKDYMTPDNQPFFGLTYHAWGLILFFCSSFLALLMPFLQSIKALFLKKRFEVNLNEILLLGAIIPLIFFYFNTQMHERYAHPAFVFIIAYSLLNRKYSLMAISSIAYFLNLEDVLKASSLTNYSTLIFLPWFIAILYSITIFLLFYDLIRIQRLQIRQFWNQEK